MSQKVRKVVIPVAGMGTRFLPVTKSVPKELLPVGTKPILQIVIEEAAASGVLLATDVADYLVARGVPFREAHAVVGGLVRELVAQGRDFSALTPADWARHSAAFGPDVADAISARASVAAKCAPQSTNPDAVRAAVEDIGRWLGRW